MSRHLNPYFHRCTDCWKWVCDCVHCVEPLNIKRQPVKDVQIRSVSYDRRRGRLEIEFTWTDDAPVLSGCTGFVSPIARGETDIFVLESSLGFRSVRKQRVRTEADGVLMIARELEELLGR